MVLLLVEVGGNKINYTIYNQRIVVRHWLTIAVPSALSLSVAFAERLLLVLQREARSGKFEVFKPQVPKRDKDKNARHPDILGDIWYWYVDPKTGEAVVIGKVRLESGCLVPRELIRVFDEICFINFSVKDLEALADRRRWKLKMQSCEDRRLKTEDDPELLSRWSLLKHFRVTNTLDRTLHLVTGIPVVSIIRFETKSVFIPHERLNKESIDSITQGNVVQLLSGYLQ
ncbi:hypothetical protein L1987_18920 [Smallanthus sonchifolius]|uniref:Uncharacterized protein n=1 Tax=Smallanthus sonchifolius TaxID=185202 RepID=A0ACB9J396_9ASTR|nr:hypothetical protein L1987_18920 [Smallanthus sonchifolius]